MTRLRRTPAAAVLVTGTALLAVTLPPATAGAAPPTPAAVPRAGALPVALSPDQRAGLLAEATAARAATAARLGLGRKERLVPRDVMKDADGTLHTRYERTYGGMPVLGGDLVVHTAPSGAAKGVNKATRARISVPATGPVRSAASARTSSLAAAEKARTKGAVVRKAPRKVVWAASGRPVLAWESVVDGTQPDGTPSELHVVTDASTGAELNRREAVSNALGSSAGTDVGTGTGRGAAETARKTAPARQRAEAKGTGHSRYNGKVKLGTSRFGSLYNMTDSARGGHRTYDAMNDIYGWNSPKLVTDTDNVWGDGTSADRQTDAVDAAYGAQVNWDYFAEVHQRYGVRNDGDGGSSQVHYSQRHRGAYWWDSCFCVKYGDGGTTPYTSIDMAAHEMASALVASTTKFSYYGESSGIGEATKDIFAAAVEFHADNPHDRGDYLTGENVDHSGLNHRHRQMDRPSKQIRGTDYWHPRIGSNQAGVYAAGPATHWFYLVSEGDGAKTVNGVAYDSPTHDGLPVTPIGREAAELIWYRALTLYMTSTTDYLGARAATLAATADLYGASSRTYHRVADAWGAVNVGVRPGGSARPVGPTFENTADYPLPAWPTQGESPITVTGVPGKAPTILLVDVNVAESSPLMELVAPDGTAYPLVNGPGGENGPSISTTGVDASSETANGTWKLRVKSQSSYPGFIDSWKLHF
ncbi:M4 family metallopeptidase [Streptomyces sp. NPDC051018]|uniref:M4 family metallopeptidase n=1 Tax=Streptomyces sp. NPDC051018 TaxID=3365639 RepID=UPI003794C008